MATTSKTTARAKTTTAKKPPRAAPSRTAKSTTRSPARSLITGEITPELRHQMIAEAAYIRAEQRGFCAGDPMEDWLHAEREVDRLLNDRAAPITQ